MGFQCVHLKSLSYSPVSTESDFILSEDVLTDMVRTKWISEKTKKMCIERKIVSQSVKSTLSKSITFTPGTSQVHVSVLEPCQSFYSRLGRVMVAYNKRNNTWHCPCAKPRQSCPHKAISKRHLNQISPELFTKVCSTDSDVCFFDTFPLEDIVRSDHNTEDVYPPQGKALAAMVRYLLNCKQIPAVLPN